MVDPQEVQDLKDFIKSLILNMRMNYGAAMALAGIDSDLIFAVHYTANEGMVDWLNK